jgi:hypothetical protein
VLKLLKRIVLDYSGNVDELEMHVVRALAAKLDAALAEKSFGADLSNDAPRPALLFGKPIEAAIKATVYNHPRTGLITV